MAAPPPISRHIFLEDIQLACSIGVHPHEERALQRVRIDVEVKLALGSEPTVDRLSATLDYEALHTHICQIVRSRHFALQETLARALYDACGDLPGVQGVRVSTRKLDAYADCTVGYRLSSF